MTENMNDNIKKTSETNVNKDENNLNINKIKNGKLIAKVLKILLCAYIIVLIIWFIKDNYINNKSIYEKIGTMYPYSVSIRDALNLKGYCLMPYKDYILSGKTKEAYDMLTEEYKSYMPYEEYLKTLEGIDFETFDLKEVKIKAEGTYVATVVYEKNGKEEEDKYLLYVDELSPQIITISPNEFIYTFKNLRAKLSNVELTILECNIFIDKIDLKAKVKNTSLFDTMEFTNVGVGYGENMSKDKDNSFTIAPGEEKEIEISYDTEYFIPNNVKLKRKLDSDTLRRYTFYFDKAKEI